MSDQRAAEQPVIVILMGSPADRDHAAKIAETATAFGVDVEQRIGSAHKTPQHVLQIIEQYEADPRPKVWVTIAGRSNALSAFVDAAVSAPVIACPPLSMPEDVWSSLRMPGDVSPMVVLDPANAAQAAVKILGVADPSIATRVRATRVARAALVIHADHTTTSDGN
ncbi:MAG TPA: 5-(carboxyamino)imidazole ribonucleotide mutase [Ilumatobacteraceae bacterium]|nr:5-(carboxyamino)imidazole ribonucleotide mutase [Ilumatobacteraceae bacterium]